MKNIKEETKFTLRIPKQLNDALVLYLKKLSTNKSKNDLTIEAIEDFLYSELAL